MIGNCNWCSSCLALNECKNDCDIDQFFDQDTGKCQDCIEECKAGCRFNDSCGMCFDRNCKECSGFGFGFCFECFDGFELMFGECFSCGIRQFFDVGMRKCQDCEVACGKCGLDGDCLSCVENAEVQDGKCRCELGFEQRGRECVRVYFDSYVKVRLDNSVEVGFSEVLNRELEIED